MARQLGRALAAAGRRHDPHPLAEARAKLLDDSARLALGRGRRHAQEPRKSLSSNRRHPERPARPRAFSGRRSIRGARLDARRARGSAWTGLIDRLVERGVDPAVVDRLAEHLSAGSAQEVARIRPLALAERFGLDPDQVVTACLHGAREGLLELHWDLLCPVCRISAQVTDTLREIAEHAHCQACHLDFELDFANSIELIFRVHPEIREAELGTFCIGGPAHSPHVVAQMRVAPHERIELELDLPEGSYGLRGPQLPWSADFLVEKTAPRRRWEIDLVAGPSAERPTALHSAVQTLVLHNTGDREILVRVERSASRNDALTAARAAALPLFRELFPGEVLAPGRLATVSSVNLLFTSLDPAKADALYRELGDSRAFGVIHEHLQKVGDAIRDGGGAVVKTLGEGVLASFSQVTAAVETALALSGRLDRDGSSVSSGLRIGVHKGRRWPRQSTTSSTTSEPPPATPSPFSRRPAMMSSC